MQSIWSHNILKKFCLLHFFIFFVNKNSGARNNYGSKMLLSKKNFFPKNFLFISIFFFKKFFVVKIFFLFYFLEKNMMIIIIYGYWHLTRCIGLCSPSDKIGFPSPPQYFWGRAFFKKFCPLHLQK